MMNVMIHVTIHNVIMIFIVVEIPLYRQMILVMLMIVQILHVIYHGQKMNGVIQIVILQNVIMIMDIAHHVVEHVNME